MTAQEDFGIVELRRYAMRPGKRDELIALFEREFIETQESCGMVPIGHYRDSADPDSFVWFRGFRNMQTRRQALHAFYVESPTWRENRAAANATLVDSDNVLLLRPARPESGFDLRGLQRGEHSNGVGSRVNVAILMLDEPAREAWTSANESLPHSWTRRNGKRSAVLVTESLPNDFPRLPVRESECALVFVSAAESHEATGASRALRAEDLPGDLRSHVLSLEVLALEPAVRCLFR